MDEAKAAELRRLHRRIGWDDLNGLPLWEQFKLSMWLYTTAGPAPAVCAADGHNWPCPTIKLLDSNDAE